MDFDDSGSGILRTCGSGALVCDYPGVQAEDEMATRDLAQAITSALPIRKPDAALYAQVPRGSVQVGAVFAELGPTAYAGAWTLDDAIYRRAEPELVQWLGHTRAVSVDASYSLPTGRILVRAVPKLRNTEYGYGAEATRPGKDTFRLLYATRLAYEGSDERIHEALPRILEAVGWARADGSCLRDLADLSFSTRRREIRPLPPSRYGAIFRRY